MKLSEAQREFLAHLSSFDRPVPRSDMRKSATRDEDKMRQACRRAGLVEFVGGWLDGKRYPMGWRITPAGREALSQSEESR